MHLLVIEFNCFYYYRCIYKHLWKKWVNRKSSMNSSVVLCHLCNNFANDFLSMGKNTMEDNWGHQQLVYQLSSKCLLFCLTEERNSYRFRTTWGWGTDRKFIFGWTVPLTTLNEQQSNLSSILSGGGERGSVGERSFRLTHIQCIRTLQTLKGPADADPWNAAWPVTRDALSHCNPERSQWLANPHLVIHSF